MFIVGEGIDKAGKTTALKRLAAKIGKRAIYREFPDRSTVSGEVIDSMLKSERALCYFQEPTAHTFASEEHQWQRHNTDHAVALQALLAVNKFEASKEIIDNQREGLVVIASRWVPSALAYGDADGLPIWWLKQIHRGLPEPDLCLLFDVEVDVAISRGAGSEAYEKRARLEKAHATYRSIWAEHRHYGDGHWIVIDAAKSADVVFAEVESWYESCRRGTIKR